MEAGTRVEVTWNDSFAGCGWFDDYENLGTTEVTTIGYYMSENETDIQLCRSKSSNGQLEGPFLVPRISAISIMRLYLPLGG